VQVQTPVLDRVEKGEDASGVNALSGRGGTRQAASGHPAKGNTLSRVTGQWRPGPWSSIRRPVGHHGHMSERQPATTSSSHRRRRDSARVLLLDPDGRVLLLRVLDPRDNKPALWVTPGGGVEPGEEIAVAAVRELEEETGLRLSISELGEPVAVCRGDWEFRGIPLYGEDWFFSQHVDTFVPSDSGWDEIEREIHQGWRWWAPDELDDADEPVLPAELADLIRSLHAGVAVGGEPRQLPWKTV
jgi:8-oxo-dGTP pyrophosphatase MutT (NUDIX family)